jgi:uncharacterized membrane protein
VSVDPWVLAAIMGMAAATYLTRAGGYHIFRALRPPQIVRDALSYVPGALFVSYVVPALASGGPQTWIGAAATMAIMLLTRQVSLAILGGTGVAWIYYAVS